MLGVQLWGVVASTFKPSDGPVIKRSRTKGGVVWRGGFEMFAVRPLRRPGGSGPRIERQRGALRWLLVGGSQDSHITHFGVMCHVV